METDEEVIRLLSLDVAAFMCNTPVDQQKEFLLSVKVFDRENIIFKTDGSYQLDLVRKGYLNLKMDDIALQKFIRNISVCKMYVTKILRQMDYKDSLLVKLSKVKKMICERDTLTARIITKLKDAPIKKLESFLIKLNPLDTRNILQISQKLSLYNQRKISSFKLDGEDENIRKFLVAYDVQKLFIEHFFQEEKKKNALETVECIKDVLDAQDIIAKDLLHWLKTESREKQEQFLKIIKSNNLDKEHVIIDAQGQLKREADRLIIDETNPKLQLLLRNATIQRIYINLIYKNPFGTLALHKSQDEQQSLGGVMALAHVLKKYIEVKEADGSSEFKSMQHGQYGAVHQFYKDQYTYFHSLLHSEVSGKQRMSKIGAGKKIVLCDVGTNNNLLVKAPEIYCTKINEKDESILDTFTPTAIHLTCDQVHFREGNIVNGNVTISYNLKEDVTLKNTKITVVKGNLKIRSLKSISLENVDLEVKQGDIEINTKDHSIICKGSKLKAGHLINISGADVIFSKGDIYSNLEAKKITISGNNLMDITQTYLKGEDIMLMARDLILGYAAKLKANNVLVEARALAEYCEDLKITKLTGGALTIKDCDIEANLLTLNGQDGVIKNIKKLKIRQGIWQIKKQFQLIKSLVDVAILLQIRSLNFIIDEAKITNNDCLTKCIQLLGYEEKVEKVHISKSNLKAHVLLIDGQDNANVKFCESGFYVSERLKVSAAEIISIDSKTNGCDIDLRAKKGNVTIDSKGGTSYNGENITMQAVAGGIRLKGGSWSYLIEDPILQATGKLLLKCRDSILATFVSLSGSNVELISEKGSIGRFFTKITGDKIYQKSHIALFNLGSADFASASITSKTKISLELASLGIAKSITKRSLLSLSAFSGSASVYLDEQSLFSFKFYNANAGLYMSRVSAFDFMVPGFTPTLLGSGSSLSLMGRASSSALVSTTTLFNVSTKGVISTVGSLLASMTGKESIGTVLSNVSLLSTPIQSCSNLFSLSSLSYMPKIVSYIGEIIPASCLDQVAEYIKDCPELLKIVDSGIISAAQTTIITGAKGYASGDIMGAFVNLLTSSSCIGAVLELGVPEIIQSIAKTLNIKFSDENKKILQQCIVGCMQKIREVYLICQLCTGQSMTAQIRSHLSGQSHATTGDDTQDKTDSETQDEKDSDTQDTTGGDIQDETYGDTQDTTGIDTQDKTDSDTQDTAEDGSKAPFRWQDIFQGTVLVEKDEGPRRGQRVDLGDQGVLVSRDSEMEGIISCGDVNVIYVQEGKGEVQAQSVKQVLLQDSQIALTARSIGKLAVSSTEPEGETARSTSTVSDGKPHITASTIDHADITGEARVNADTIGALRASKCDIDIAAQAIDGAFLDGVSGQLSVATMEALDVKRYDDSTPLQVKSEHIKTVSVTKDGSCAAGSDEQRAALMQEGSECLAELSKTRPEVATLPQAEAEADEATEIVISDGSESDVSQKVEQEPATTTGLKIKSDFIDELDAREVKVKVTAQTIGVLRGEQSALDVKADTVMAVKILDTIGKIDAESIGIIKTQESTDAVSAGRSPVAIRATHLGKASVTGERSDIVADHIGKLETKSAVVSKQAQDTDTEQEVIKPTHHIVAGKIDSFDAQGGRLAVQADEIEDVNTTDTTGQVIARSIEALRASKCDIDIAAQAIGGAFLDGVSGQLSVETMGVLDVKRYDDSTPLQVKSEHIKTVSVTKDGSCAAGSDEQRAALMQEGSECLAELSKTRPEIATLSQAEAETDEATEIVISDGSESDVSQKVEQEPATTTGLKIKSDFIDELDAREVKVKVTAQTIGVLRGEQSALDVKADTVMAVKTLDTIGKIDAESIGVIETQKSTDAVSDGQSPVAIRATHLGKAVVTGERSDIVAGHIGKLETISAVVSKQAQDTDTEQEVGEDIKPTHHIVAGKIDSFDAQGGRLAVQADEIGEVKTTDTTGQVTAESIGVIETQESTDAVSDGQSPVAIRATHLGKVVVKGEISDIVADHIGKLETKSAVVSKQAQDTDTEQEVIKPTHHIVAGKIDSFDAQGGRLAVQADEIGDVNTTDATGFVIAKQANTVVQEGSDTILLIDKVTGKARIVRCDGGILVSEYVAQLEVVDGKPIVEVQEVGEFTIDCATGGRIIARDADGNPIPMKIGTFKANGEYKLDVMMTEFLEDVDLGKGTVSHADITASKFKDFWKIVQNQGDFKTTHSLSITASEQTVDCRDCMRSDSTREHTSLRVKELKDSQQGAQAGKTSAKPLALECCQDIIGKQVAVKVDQSPKYATIGGKDKWSRSFNFDLLHTYLTAHEVISDGDLSINAKYIKSRLLEEAKAAGFLVQRDDQGQEAKFGSDSVDFGDYEFTDKCFTTEQRDGHTRRTDEYADEFSEFMQGTIFDVAGELHLSASDGIFFSGLLEIVGRERNYWSSNNTYIWAHEDVAAYDTSGNTYSRKLIYVPATIKAGSFTASSESAVELRGAHVDSDDILLYSEDKVIFSSLITAAEEIQKGKSKKTDTADLTSYMSGYQQFAASTMLGGREHSDVVSSRALAFSSGAQSDGAIIYDDQGNFIPVKSSTAKIAIYAPQVQYDAFNTVEDVHIVTDSLVHNPLALTSCSHIVKKKWGGLVKKTYTTDTSAVVSSSIAGNSYLYSRRSLHKTDTGTSAAVHGCKQESEDDIVYPQADLSQDSDDPTTLEDDILGEDVTASLSPVHDSELSQASMDKEQPPLQADATQEQIVQDESQDVTASLSPVHDSELSQASMDKEQPPLQADATQAQIAQDENQDIPQGDHERVVFTDCDVSADIDLGPRVLSHTYDISGLNVRKVYVDLDDDAITKCEEQLTHIYDHVTRRGFFVSKPKLMTGARGGARLLASMDTQSVLQNPLSALDPTSLLIMPSVSYGRTSTSTDQVSKSHDFGVDCLVVQNAGKLAIWGNPSVDSVKVDGWLGEIEMSSAEHSYSMSSKQTMMRLGSSVASCITGISASKSSFSSTTESAFDLHLTGTGTVGDVHGVVSSIVREGDVSILGDIDIIGAKSTQSSSSYSYCAGGISRAFDTRHFRTSPMLQGLEGYTGVVNGEECNLNDREAIIEMTYTHGKHGGLDFGLISDMYTIIGNGIAISEQIAARKDLLLPSAAEQPEADARAVQESLVPQKQSQGPSDHEKKPTELTPTTQTTSDILQPALAETSEHYTPTSSHLDHASLEDGLKGEGIMEGNGGPHFRTFDDFVADSPILQYVTATASGVSDQEGEAPAVDTSHGREMRGTGWGIMAGMPGFYHHDEQGRGFEKAYMNLQTGAREFIAPFLDQLEAFGTHVGDTVDDIIDYPLKTIQHGSCSDMLTMYRRAPQGEPTTLRKIGQGIYETLFEPQGAIALWDWAESHRESLAEDDYLGYATVYAKYSVSVSVGAFEIGIVPVGRVMGGVASTAVHGYNGFVRGFSHMPSSSLTQSTLSSSVTRLQSTVSFGSPHLLSYRPQYNPQSYSEGLFNIAAFNKTSGQGFVNSCYRYLPTERQLAFGLKYFEPELQHLPSSIFGNVLPTKSPGVKFILDGTTVRLMTGTPKGMQRLPYMRASQDGRTIGLLGDGVGHLMPGRVGERTSHLPEAHMPIDNWSDLLRFLEQNGQSSGK